jgi:hypothetical protein
MRFACSQFRINAFRLVNPNALEFILSVYCAGNSDCSERICAVVLRSLSVSLQLFDRHINFIQISADFSSPSCVHIKTVRFTSTAMYVHCSLDCNSDCAEVLDGSC